MNTVTSAGPPEAPGGDGPPAAPPPARRRRAPMAAVLATAAAGALAATGVAAALLLRPHPAPRRPHPLKGTVFTLRAGQCADTAPNGVASARSLPCTQPHQLEIYGEVRLNGHAWPGAGALASQARRGCLRLLAGYLNPQLDTGNLAEAYVYPDQGAWQAGERTAVCEIRGATGLLTGPVRAVSGPPGAGPAPSPGR